MPVLSSQEWVFAHAERAGDFLIHRSRRHRPPHLQLTSGQAISGRGERGGPVQRYWTNFAKTGNPNDPNDGELPKWLRFDPDSRAYWSSATRGPRAKEGLRRPQCDLFIEHLGGPKAK